MKSNFEIDIQNITDKYTSKIDSIFQLKKKKFYPSNNVRRLQIKSILNDDYVGKNITVYGWVKTFRSNRFINLNDGSCLNDLQCVVDYENLKNQNCQKLIQVLA